MEPPPLIRTLLLALCCLLIVAAASAHQTQDEASSAARPRDPLPHPILKRDPEDPAAEGERTLGDDVEKCVNKRCQGHTNPLQFAWCVLTECMETQPELAALGEDGLRTKWLCLLDCLPKSKDKHPCYERCIDDKQQEDLGPVPVIPELTFRDQRACA
jgi:hypothetical protein